MARRQARGGKTLRIREFVHSVQVDPSYFHNTWDKLRRAIVQIQHHEESELSFEELYRNSYNLVHHKYGELLYKNLDALVSDHMCTLAQLVEASMSRQGGGPGDGTVFLSCLRHAWEEHTTAMLMVRDILLFMDRNYVPGQKLLPVYDLGLVKFRQEVVLCPHIATHLRRTLLAMVAKERSGETIDRLELKAACTMLVDLGVDSGKLAYEQEFERHFIDQARAFFHHESSRLLGGASADDGGVGGVMGGGGGVSGGGVNGGGVNGGLAEGDVLGGVVDGTGHVTGTDASSYLRHVQRRLNEERERVRHCLDAGTEDKVVQVIETQMLLNHMQEILSMGNSGVARMFEDRKMADLRLVYTLFARVQGGHAAVGATIREHLLAKGHALNADEARSSAVAGAKGSGGGGGGVVARLTCWVRHLCDGNGAPEDNACKMLVLGCLGRCYLAMGNGTEAARCFERVLDLAEQPTVLPELPEVPLSPARVGKGQTQKAGAMPRWRDAQRASAEAHADLADLDLETQRLYVLSQAPAPCPAVCAGSAGRLSRGSGALPARQPVHGAW
eukprot:m.408064 g.408064  ORF g.408064 m.408064 type:complete len:559 (-) comp20142_c1_seq3:1095-2771(-)